MNLPPGHRKINARHSDVVVGVSDRSLFQLHEEQDEDRPDPDGYWKLRRLCISEK
jgi:hypothetical protein